MDAYRLWDDCNVRPKSVQVDRVRSDAIVINVTFGQYASQECERQRTLRVRTQSALFRKHTVKIMYTFPLPVRPTVASKNTELAAVKVKRTDTDPLPRLHLEGYLMQYTRTVLETV